MQNQKVVWITGAGSGLGQGMAIEFAQRGFRTVLSGRREERLQETAHEIEANYPDSTLIEPCDVCQEDSLKGVVDAIHQKWGRLDIAVANAGYGVTGYFEDISLQQWRGQIETNVLGVVATLQYALPLLRQSGGRMAVVSSVSGILASPQVSPYCASKFALVGLCRSLQMELKGSGVSLTHLLPGFVHSEIGQVDNNGVHHPQKKDQRPGFLMWKTDRAAKKMVRAILARKKEVVFTAHGRFGAFIGQHLPGLAGLLQSFRKR